MCWWPVQARGRHKMGYYSDSDDEGAPPAPITNGTAPRASHTKAAVKSGGGKKDPAAERRARLLGQESEVRPPQAGKFPSPSYSLLGQAPFLL